MCMPSWMAQKLTVIYKISKPIYTNDSLIHNVDPICIAF